MAFSSKQENDYDRQLEQIAGEVDSYIVKTDGALEYFREQIRPLAQRWKTYYEAVDKRKKELLDHWELVKKNPKFQDKNLTPHNKNWEWDRFYLADLPIGPDDKIQNPKNYMPAKLTSIYLKNLKGYIDRNKEKLKTLLFASSECKKLQDTIAAQEQQYNEIETQYNKLTDEQQKNHRFFVEVMWYRYVYSLEEESEKVFGCWRPPLTPLPEHPLKILKPAESGYQRNQTRKELPNARNTQEEYERYYIFLSSVHDNYLQGVEKITEGIWLNNLPTAVLCCLDKGHGDKTAFLKAALERVCHSNHKTDKKIKPATPEPEKENGKGKLIIILSIITVFIAILIFFFGDNIWGRLNEKLKNNKPAAEQSEIPKTENKITTEAKTSGDNSPIVGGDYVEGDKIVSQKLSESDKEEIVTRIAERLEPQLSKQYPIAHTIFGVYQDGLIVPNGLMPENLEIDWDTGKVQSTNNNVLIVTLPDMILNGKSFVNRNVTFLEKRVGAKTKPIIIIGEFNPILEVIGIHDELVVVALGFPADDSKK